jgi:hypothetical protein
MSNLNTLRRDFSSNLMGQVEAYQTSFRETLMQGCGLQVDFIQVRIDTYAPNFNLVFKFLIKTTSTAAEVSDLIQRLTGLDTDCDSCFLLRDSAGWLLVQTVSIDTLF